MKRAKFWGGILLAAAVFSASACTDKNENIYTLADVNVGDAFKITLQASDMYSWHFDIDSERAIEYVAMDFVPTDNDPEIIGGGQLLYTFRAKETGKYKIRFDLQIAWESEPPIETKIYEITII